MEDFESALQSRMDIASIDVVIIDYLFDCSDRTGLDLVQELRQRYGYTGTIIGCSGDDNLKPCFLSLGASLFWSKPPPSNSDILLNLLEAEENKRAARRRHQANVADD